MFVVIARSDIADALQKQVPFDPRRLLVFRDADSLSALNTIVTRRPPVLVIDPLFATTPRGGAVIARVRADPNLANTAIRALTLENDAQILRLLQECAAAPEATLLSLSHPLQWWGTRQAPRFPLVPEAQALVNGKPCQIVNLSAAGVHLVTTNRLRPTEEFRLTLVKGEAMVRLRVVVTWATLQILTGVPSYRAGGQFVEIPDSKLIDTYCQGDGTEPMLTDLPNPVCTQDCGSEGVFHAGTSDGDSATRDDLR